jgi:hypothetical protein
MRAFARGISLITVSLIWGDRMAVQKKSIRQSAWWAGGGIGVVVVGLVMILHERHSHDSCIVSTFLHGQDVAPTPSCGFVDTVYWAGVVLLIMGSLFLAGALGNAMAYSAKSGGAVAMLMLRLKRLVGIVQIQTPEKPTRHVLPHNYPTEQILLRPRQMPGPGYNLPVLTPESRHESLVMATATNSVVDQPIRSHPLSTIAPVVQTPPPAPVAPPAAWYPDPENQGAIRWWDGSAWGPSRPTTN